MLRRLLSLFAVLGLLAGARSVLAAAPPSDAPASVTIAYQPGLSYATLIVLKQQGALKKLYPGTTFDWRVLSNGAAIRDGIIAGQIQIGAGGNGPFLVGWDRGVGYRLIGGLNEINLWMMAKDPKYKTLKDLPSTAKIGLPGPDAIQAVVLRRAAQEQLGNPHQLDANMVAIEHPLGMQALSVGQLDAHFTSPPFQQEELAAGAHVLLKSYDVMGRSTFNSVYTTEPFEKDHPRFVEAFYRELGVATAFIKAHPDETAQLLEKDSEGKIKAEQWRKWLGSPDITWSTVPRGFLKYATYMKSIGILQKAPASMREIELPELKGEGD